jgi:hypothetical protein
VAPLRRGGPALAAALVALAALSPASSPATAAPATPSGAVEAPHTGACTHPDGVTVVVDFAAFGGGVAVRCAGWPVDSGYDALRRAGFQVTDTQRYPGLLCRIDGLPADQACVVAPPASAYWGYWHARRGGDWTYSSQGAGTREPTPGSVEGWAFGPDARPGVAPPGPLPVTTTTRPPAPPAPTSSGAPPVSAAPSPTPDGPSAPPAPGAPVTASTTTTVAAPPSTDVDPGGAPASPIDDGDAVALGDLAASGGAGPPSSGSPWSVAVTAGIVVVLAAVGVTAARRRRSEA